MVHPVDIHVGKRIKEARILRGQSQSEIARELDISFQQIQKYESGKNRISASRLFELSQLFGISPSFFFDGLEEGADEIKQPMDAETARIALAILKIPNKRTRSLLISLAQEVSREEAS
ncbi:MAG: helix-turn-helix transcriptional regulator [Paracoccaceae bacterium]|jgi:transcriptional regulator with XRE-family HTH domain|nr:helix-turn-helix transcriptional regulator [Paracoccaceae bacterium]